MIEPTTLDNAIWEAERFLEKAKTLRDCHSDHKTKYAKTGRYSAVAEHAAVMRSSMDLTRILADLRQNR